MNERVLRPAHVAAATLALGGLLVMAFPEHAASIVRLAIATIAGAAALHALIRHVPTGGWLSPFRWMSPFHPDARPRPRGSEEIDSIRSKLGGWRHPMEAGPPLPPDIVRLLKPVIASILEMDPKDERRTTAAREYLSPLAAAILGHDPGSRSAWIPKLPPNRSEVTEAVHRVLDELDDFAEGTPT